MPGSTGSDSRSEQAAAEVMSLNVILSLRRTAHGSWERLQTRARLCATDPKRTTHSG